MSKVPRTERTFHFTVEGVCKFMQEVSKGLANPNAMVPQSRKDKSLGDRTTYIGASSATGCLHKAYKDVWTKPDVDAKQIFVFERGHQLEEMIRKGLNGAGWVEVDTVSKWKAGTKTVVHQEEVQGIGQYNFLKAHIDFIFVSAHEIVVKEIKSAASIPLVPYMSHQYQLMLQLWLLKSKYPNRKIRGSVVYHNWDTGESIDYPIAYNVVIAQAALRQATLLWSAYQTGNIPEPTVQLYCSKCPYKGTCPKLCFGAEQELPDDLIVLAQKVVDFKAAKKDVKKLEKNFLALLQSAGLKKAVLGETILEVKKGKYGFYLSVV